MTTSNHVGGLRILVTGAAGGIGRPLATRLIQQGAHVALTDLRSSSLDSIASSIGGGSGSSVAIPGDIADFADARRIVDVASERLGGLDGLVNLATVSSYSSLLEATKDDWDRVMSVNLRGAFAVSQAAARVMARDGGGSIVLFGSVTSMFAAPGQALYGVSKAGLLALVRSMAVEWARMGIRVCGVSPTTTETALSRDWLDEGDRRVHLTDIIPMGRLGEPEDSFGLVSLLLSPAGRFMTGHTYFVDGGVSVVHPLIR